MLKEKLYKKKKGAFLMEKQAYLIRKQIKTQIERAASIPVNPTHKPMSPLGERSGIMQSIKNPMNGSTIGFCTPTDNGMGMIYIKPECRRQGFAKMAVLKFKEDHPDMTWDARNEASQGLWDSVNS